MGGLGHGRRNNMNYSLSVQNFFPGPPLSTTKKFKFPLMTGVSPNSETLTFVLRSHPYELVR